MKHGILSIIVAILGYVFFFHIHLEFADIVQKLNENQQLNGPNLIITPRIYKIATLIIGLIGVYFGIKGFKNYKNLSIVGISLSLILIILSFIPIWKYLL